MPSTFPPFDIARLFARNLKRIALLYFAFLTLLLVVRNPLDLFGHQEYVVAAFRLLSFMVHFLTFTLLGWLMLAARWPLRSDMLLVLLVVYAAVTELVQFFIPGRTPDMLDLAQDVAGLALGATAWWAWQWLVERRPSWKESS